METGQDYCFANPWREIVEVSSTIGFLLMISMGGRNG
jgi:hypothetical protein